jgi:hypothetical protein
VEVAKQILAVLAALTPGTAAATVVMAEFNRGDTAPAVVVRAVTQVTEETEVAVDLQAVKRLEQVA